MREEEEGRRKKEEGKEGEVQVWHLYRFGNLVWNISFFWKLILVGLEILFGTFGWNSCLG